MTQFCIFSQQNPNRSSTLPPHLSHRHSLYDHLRNSLSAQSLASLEGLALESSEPIKDGGEQQNYGCSNQARSPCPDADPLDNAHGEIKGSAEVVCLELADEGIELGGGRADAEKQRDL